MAAPAGVELPVPSESLGGTSAAPRALSLSLPPGFTDRPEDILAKDKKATGVNAETSAEAMLAVGSSV